MVLFGIVAALMVAAAVAFVLVPLLRGGSTGEAARDRLNVALYRDRRRELEAEQADGTLSPEEFAKTEAELQRDLLANVGEETARPAPTAAQRWIAWPVALGIPLIALPLYLVLGEPSLVDETATAGLAEADSAAAPDMESALEELAARLEQDPQNVEGWVLLGRSLTALGRHSQAANAFARGIQFLGEESDLLLGRAQALAMGQAQRLDGEPIALVQRVLDRDPDHPQAHWLAGIHAFEHEEYARALEHWQTVKGLIGDGEMGASVDEAIARARSMGDFAEVAPAELGEPLGSADASSLSVRVTVSASVAAQLPAEATVFIFARPPGQRMPIAATRRPARELPLTVSLGHNELLGDGDLGQFDRLEVVARISASGDAAATAGDLEGTIRMAPGTAAELVIDRLLE